MKNALIRKYLMDQLEKKTKRVKYLESELRKVKYQLSKCNEKDEGSMFTKEDEGRMHDEYTNNMAFRRIVETLAGMSRECFMKHSDFRLVCEMASRINYEMHMFDLEKQQ